MLSCSLSALIQSSFGVSQPEGAEPHRHDTRPGAHPLFSELLLNPVESRIVQVQAEVQRLAQRMNRDFGIANGGCFIAAEIVGSGFHFAQRFPHMMDCFNYPGVRSVFLLHGGRRCGARRHGLHAASPDHSGVAPAREGVTEKTWLPIGNDSSGAPVVSREYSHLWRTKYDTPPLRRPSPPLRLACSPLRLAGAHVR